MLKRLQKILRKDLLPESHGPCTMTIYLLTQYCESYCRKKTWIVYPIHIGSGLSPFSCVFFFSKTKETLKVTLLDDIKNNMTQLQPWFHTTNSKAALKCRLGVLTSLYYSSQRKGITMVFTHNVYWNLIENVFRLYCLTSLFSICKSNTRLCTLLRNGRSVYSSRVILPHVGCVNLLRNSCFFFNIPL